MPHPFHIIDDEIAYLELYENYIVSQIKEDIVFDLEELSWLVMVVENYYPNNNKVGYISNRTNNYNAKPLIYKHIDIYKKVISIAIVCYSDFAKKNALYEQSFHQKPFKVFTDLENAINWTLQQQKK